MCIRQNERIQLYFNLNAQNLIRGSKGQNCHLHITCYENETIFKTQITQKHVTSPDEVNRLM